MGRVITYLVLAIFLVNTVSLNQLPKIPLLIIHYLEHQDATSNLSFLQFLNMHYVGHDGDDNDNDRDMQLPYKKMDFSYLQGFTLPQFKAALDTPLIDYQRQSSPTLRKRFWADHAITALFKPPKVEA